MPAALASAYASPGIAKILLKTLSLVYDRGLKSEKNVLVKPLKHSIIGEYRDKGFIEALVPGVGSSLRVCIRIPARADASAYLRIADSLLPALLADVSAAEEIASKAVESDTRSSVFDVWIETDGTASYTCGFLDGEMEGELVDVERGQDGVLSIAGQAG